MGFITPGETLKNLRKRFYIKQSELEAAGISRNFISMFECNKRKLSEETAKKVVRIIREVAEKSDANIDEELDYLYISAEDAALRYCNHRINNLKDVISFEDIQEIINICEKYEFVDTLYRTIILKGNRLYDIGEYKRAFQCFSDALAMAMRTDESDELSFLYNKLGKCKIHLVNYEEALVYFEKSYRYSVISENDTYIKNALFNVALTYKKLDRIDRSLDYITKFISTVDKDKFRGDYINVLMLKANCYLAKKEYKETIILYESLENMLSDSEGTILGYIYNNLGFTYFKLNKLEKSLEYFDKAQAFREARDEINLAVTLIEKAEVLIEKNCFDEAIELIQHGLEVAREYNRNESVICGYMLLEDIYLKNKDIYKLEYTYLSALEFLKKIEDFEKIIVVLNKLSLLYLNRGKIDLAKSYLQEAIEIQEK